MVHHAHLLGGLLGAHHDERRQNGDTGKQHRRKERDKKETLLLDLVQVFPFNDDS